MLTAQGHDRMPRGAGHTGKAKAHRLLLLLCLQRCRGALGGACIGIDGVGQVCGARLCGVHMHTGWVARPSPLRDLERVVAQLRCDRGLHHHVPLRFQPVPVVGGVNVVVDTAV